ncbi:putative defensin, plant [Rosa chinensis]|uniref:Putative defensin, plant n=1 Tax=Rosa chinensis TaxID=74649 RepID=A0A2P6Q884_ROSCH|nr:putative defensin, plant [Rosa chinensis]
MDRKFLGLLLFFIILLNSQEMVIRSEAKICEVPSKTFKGLCVKDRNCVVRCHSEGYGNGKCSHVRRQCMCLKICD